MYDRFICCWYLSCIVIWYMHDYIEIMKNITFIMSCNYNLNICIYINSPRKIPAYVITQTNCLRYATMYFNFKPKDAYSKVRRQIKLWQSISQPSQNIAGKPNAGSHAIAPPHPCSIKVLNRWILLQNRLLPYIASE